MVPITPSAGRHVLENKRRGAAREYSVPAVLVAAYLDAFKEVRMRNMVESRESLGMDTMRPGDARRDRSRLAAAGILLVACLVLFATVPPTQAQAQAQSDTFELKPLWTITAENGSVGLSSDQHHSGATAAVLSSRSGGQRNVWLQLTYPAPRKGALSVWFYDTAAGSSTLYSGLYASNSVTPAEDFSVNVADWNPTTYVWHGPGVGETATAVTRTVGWHNFSLQVTATAFNAFIDGILVGSVSGDFAFDSIRLVLSGPSWRPNATFYFDDFRISREPTCRE